MSTSTAPSVAMVMTSPMARLALRFLLAHLPVPLPPPLLRAQASPVGPSRVFDHFFQNLAVTFTPVQVFVFVSDDFLQLFTPPPPAFARLLLEAFDQRHRLDGPGRGHMTLVHVALDPLGFLQLVIGHDQRQEPGHLLVPPRAEAGSHRAVCVESQVEPLFPHFVPTVVICVVVVLQYRLVEGAATVVILLKEQQQEDKYPAIA